MLKSIFSGLYNAVADNTGRPIFICLAVVVPQIYEIPRKFSENYSRSRSFKVIDLGASRKRMQLPVSH